MSSAAAVPIPPCPDTCIHDVDDLDPPSSGATYTKAPEGNTIVPIAVDGYGINLGHEYRFPVRVLDKDGNVVWEDDFVPGGGAHEIINAQIPPDTPAGACDIEMYSDLGWWPADELQLQEGEEIPEFSTMAIPVASVLGLLFYFNYRRSKRNS